jgi:hypothetical protein
VACSCEQCNEPSRYTRSWEILQKMSKWCHLKDSKCSDHLYNLLTLRIWSMKMLFFSFHFQHLQ